MTHPSIHQFIIAKQPSPKPSESLTLFPPFSSLQLILQVTKPTSQTMSSSSPLQARASTIIKSGNQPGFQSPSCCHLEPSLAGPPPHPAMKLVRRRFTMAVPP
jgi:hypothetical protein